MSLTFATEKELAVDNTPAESSLDSLDGTTFDSDEESKPVEEAPKPEPKPLPSLKDLPSLVDSDSFKPATKVEWGPNMKPAAISSSVSPSMSRSASATSAGRLDLHCRSLVLVLC